MMNVISILVSGYVILFGAILINLLAHKMRLFTWYDLLMKKKKIDIKSAVFLFLVYPLLLGMLAYV